MGFELFGGFGFGWDLRFWIRFVVWVVKQLMPIILELE